MKEESIINKKYDIKKNERIIMKQESYIKLQKKYSLQNRCLLSELLLFQHCIIYVNDASDV